MTDTVPFIRLYADDQGESHFADDAFPMTLVAFAPPAPAVFVSTPEVATRSLLLLLPDGWFGDLHPAPSRQLMVMMSGALEVTVSDGEVRTFVAGDAVLVEDTVGRGHATKSVRGDAVVAVTQAPR